MPTTRTHQGKRQTILVAADELFDAKGYTATTIEEVASAAGIAKGSVYTYFRSKEELFEQVFVNAVADIETQVFDIFAQPISAAEKLQRLVDYRFDAMDQTKPIGRLVLEFWATAAREQQGRLAAVLGKMYGRWREEVAAVLNEGDLAGEFGREFNTPAGAALIVAVLDGIEVEALLGYGPELDQEYRDALKRAILTALATGKS